MTALSKMTTLIRREVWESRSLWIVPLVISGVILIVAAFGQIHVGHDGEHNLFQFLTFLKSDDGDPSGLYGITMFGFAMVQLVALGIVVFFYLLDSLLAERKDRSILFWKSLPVSDTQVVGSKGLTGLVLAPGYVLLITALTQLAFGLIWWIRFGSTPLGGIVVPFDGSTWLEVQLSCWALAFTVMVWYLPLAGYLLLVSVWARKNGFLWAILPPIGLMLVEGVLLPTHWFAQFVGERFGGVFRIIGEAGKNRHLAAGTSDIGDFLQLIGSVFTHYELWAGVIAAAIMFFVVVRLRRYRDDT